MLKQVIPFAGRVSLSHYFIRRAVPGLLLTLRRFIAYGGYSLGDRTPTSAQSAFAFSMIIHGYSHPFCNVPQLTLMLLLANLAITKICKKSEK